MTSVMRALPALAAAILLAAPAAAQQLTVERIFGSPEFRVDGLPELTWMAGGARYTYVERQADGSTDLIAIHAESGQRQTLVEGRRLLPPGAARPIAIQGYSWSSDESRLLIYTDAQQVWRQATRGRYYVYEPAGGTLVPVSTADGWQQFAKFSPDARRVGFVRDNDLFVAEIGTGREIRLTHDGSEDIINGTFDWVYEEELDLRDGWRWSPDGRRIAFWQLDQSPVPVFHMVDELQLYPRLIPLKYPKAGDANSHARIGVVAAEGGDIRWMEATSAGDHYLARMDWAASSDELVIQRLNRHQNRLEVMLADAATGRTRQLFAETSEAWVDVDFDLTWLAGGREFLWTSERDGFRHIYVVPRSGGAGRPLTRGSWDVATLHGVDERGGWVYFTGTEAGPAQRQLYRVRLNGRGLERLSRDAGHHAPHFNPTLSHYIDAHTSFGQPAAISLHRADGTAVRTLVDNARVRERLGAERLGAHEFFSFQTRDGTALHGWMIRPPDFDPSRRYPVVMHVYGGPGSQRVLDTWAGTRYLWHQMLAQQGYIVVTVDNRGTGGRGAAFRQSVYLRLGQLETSDQIEAARHLAALPYVDGARIGIWGWSYGAYLAALALARGGELFRGAIAVAPVTDWRLYDTIYTERYMRTPAENPEGYRLGAPAQHVAGVRGRLLLVHGSGDDNVHFQNSAMLVDALIREGKQFDFMMYPNRNHSIGAPLHLYRMLTEWIVRHI
jgi:dipeptidyl-peptidase 4